MSSRLEFLMSASALAATPPMGISLMRRLSCRWGVVEEILEVADPRF
jgi:hypothetical protein